MYVYSARQLRVISICLWNGCFQVMFHRMLLNKSIQWYVTYVWGTRSLAGYSSPCDAVARV